MTFVDSCKVNFHNVYTFVICANELSITFVGWKWISHWDLHVKPDVKQHYHNESLMSKGDHLND